MRPEDLPSIVSGMKVYYEDPYTGERENGMIQTFIPPLKGEEITEVFVVYKSTCGGQWDKYWNFTAQRTRLESLHKGWSKKLNWSMNKLIELNKNAFKDR